MNLTLGRRFLRSTVRVHEDDVARMMAEQQDRPVVVKLLKQRRAMVEVLPPMLSEHRRTRRTRLERELEGRTYWMFRDRFYWEDEGLTADEVYALLVARQRRRKRQIEQAQREVP